MLLEYLKTNNFDKQLKILNKKLSGKKIMIYGAGKLFEEIIKNYDLSDLDIVGITDKKFYLDQKDKNYFGYKVYYYTDFLKENFEVMLVATQQYDSILNKYKYIGKTVMPFCKQNFITILKNKTKKFINSFSKNNKVVLVKQNGQKIYNPKIKNLSIKFNGRNNYVEFKEPFSIERSFSIVLGNNNNIYFDEFCEVSKMVLELGNNNTFISGSYNWFCNVNLWNTYLNDTKISIGNDCKLSYAVEIKATDAHTVYDKETLEVLNPPKDIKIGNHVWISRGCFIIKGAVIPNNCVVGANSLVNKKFEEENCIIAGSPAKIVKREINWSRKVPEKPKTV